MSPHLQVWRWHVTMLTSILHRVTGVGLYLAGLIAAVWAIALAGGADSYSLFLVVMASWFGKLIFAGMSLSLFFHLGNGVRHIIWDFGHGLSKEDASASSFAVLGFAIAATGAVWAIAFMMGLL
ncbi:MAG TPA: succinate dehydrogenase, cytochrome b556 subunit [Phenylobacterium sp.]|jgi:succinate dehydrogenase / fumarate reductase cytochrome b subunit